MELSRFATILAVVLSLSIHVLMALALSLPTSGVVGGESIFIEIKKGVKATSPKTAHRSLNTKIHPILKSKSPPPVSNVSHGENVESIAGSDLGLKVEYPRLSRILAEEGEVLVGIDSSRASLLSSSGHKRLDQAALLAVQSGLDSGHLLHLIQKREVLKISFVFHLTEMRNR